MFSSSLLQQAESILTTCRRRDLRLATAESCTGGLIAGLLTEIPGSSDVLDRGFVVYSNAAKTAMLGVPADLVERVGAVSEDVAGAMAEGAIVRSDADFAIACSGVAGPGGASESKPVGLVHIACAARRGPTLHRRCEFGDVGRSVVRQRTIAEALALIADRISAIDGGPAGQPVSA